MTSQPLRPKCGLDMALVWLVQQVFRLLYHLPRPLAAFSKNGSDEFGQPSFRRCRNPGEFLVIFSCP